VNDWVFQVSLLRGYKFSLQGFTFSSLTNPSSGMTPAESCFGSLESAPSGFGRPEDVKQLRSCSLSLTFIFIKLGHSKIIIKDLN